MPSAFFSGQGEKFLRLRRKNQKGFWPLHGRHFIKTVATLWPKPLFWISRLRREIFSSCRFEFCQRQNSKRQIIKNLFYVFQCVNGLNVLQTCQAEPFDFAQDKLSRSLLSLFYSSKIKVKMVLYHLRFKNHKKKLIKSL
jgi:hypothetical protein